MNLAFLPKKLLKSQTFMRASVSGQASPSLVSNMCRQGFYYIGKNTTSVDKLVHLFKRGYASLALSDAKAELEQTLALEKNTAPELIYCEGSFSETAVKQFTEFLSAHPTLSTVPFIISETGFSEKELTSFLNSPQAEKKALH